MSIAATTYVAAGEGGGIANKNVKLLNGRGQIRQEQALGANNVWDFVDTIYNSLGQPKSERHSLRSGDAAPVGPEHVRCPGPSQHRHRT